MFLSRDWCISTYFVLCLVTMSLTSTLVYFFSRICSLKFDYKLSYKVFTNFSEI